MNARVAIVEDQTMFLQLLSGMIRAQPEIELIATATTVASACAMLSRFDSLDLLILDLDLPDGDGTEVLRQAIGSHPGIECIILSGHANQFIAPPDLRTCIRAVIDKTEAYDHLRMALHDTRAVRSGGRLNRSADPGRKLTPRQLEIFRLIGGGLSSKEIATHLFIAVTTVETHRKAIAGAMGASGPDLVRLASTFNLTWLAPF